MLYNITYKHIKGAFCILSTAASLSEGSEMCHLKTNKQTEEKHDDCQHNLALIYTDLTSSIVFILDAHGGEALIAVSRLQLHPIHLLINYTVKSWH